MYFDQKHGVIVYLAKEKEVEKDSKNKYFDWKQIIYAIYGIAPLAVLTSLGVLYANDQNQIFFWALILISLVGCVFLVAPPIVVLSVLIYKKHRDSSRKFKKLYFKYVEHNIKDLEKFHRFTFIKSRTCSKIKWSNDVGRFLPDVDNIRTYSVHDIIENVSKSKTRPVVIMGEMGIGKSVFSLEILKKNIANKIVTIHIELSQWPTSVDYENQEAFASNIAKAMLEANQRLSNEARNDKTKNSNEKFRLSLEEYLEKRKSLIILEGIDEFKGERRTILWIAERLVDLEHQVIITGRDYSIAQLEPRFETGRPIFVETFKLDLLQDTQIELFIEKFVELSKLDQAIPLETLKEIIEPSENYPELNYRNPLVIQAIAHSYSTKNTNENTKRKKLNIFDILEQISTYIFKWHTGKEVDMKPFTFERSSKDGYDFPKLKIQYFQVHQKLACMSILENVLSEAKLEENLNSVVNNGNSTTHKELVTSIITNNVGFVIRSSTNYQILPDRMLDYFIVKNILDCIMLKKQEELKQILKIVISNTRKFANLVSLLHETMKKLPKCDFYSKVELKPVEKINGMNVIQQLGLKWNDQNVQTIDGKIISLNLSWARIKFLPKNFGELSELQELDLSGNKFSSLPGSIGSLKNLRELRLYNTQLSSLPESLSSLKNLRELYLLCNKLSSLPESIGSLKKLQGLYLKENQLSSLPESLSSFQELRVLSLADNALSSLPESLDSLQELRVLDLDYNALSSLPENISLLHNLRELYLSGNKLPSLPESIGFLQELKSLSLNNNQLFSLPKSISSLKNLRELHLDNNQLSSLPESIGSLQELRELYLRENQLSSLPESIGSLKNLRELHLGNNQLSSLPKSISSLKNPQRVDLSNNQLSSFPKSISSLKNLQRVDLSNNQLPSLPKSISSLQELQWLNLGNNQLSSLPKSISSLKNLRELYLDRNLLLSLSQNMPNLLKKLRKNGCKIVEL